MNINDFDNGSSASSGGTYYATPRWDDFTLDDEKRARARFSRFFLSATIYLVVATAVIYAAMFAIRLAMGDNAGSVLNSMWFTWGAQVVAMYMIAFPLLYMIVRGMRSTVRVKSKMKFGEFLKLFCVAEAFMMVGNIIGETLNSVIDLFVPGDITDTTEELILNSPVWVIILVAVIIGPIVEELIFRKLLMDKLGIYGDRIAIVVSAVAFGLFHGNLYQFFYATLLGLVLAYIYSRTSNIIYPILMHMTLNFFGSIVPLPVLENTDRFMELYNIFLETAEENTAEFYALYGEEFSRLSLIVGGYSLIVYTFVIAGIVIFIRNRRRIFVSDRCEVLIPRERRASVILGNVGAIAFIVLAAINIILHLIPTGTGV